MLGGGFCAPMRHAMPHVPRKPRPETKGLADPSSELLALFGITPTATGITISANIALQVPAVQSAVRIISDAAACLDVGVKVRDADGTERDAPDHPANLLLRGAANDWTSGFELIRDLVIDALTDDRGGMVWANRLASGRVAELIRYRNGVMQVDFDSSTGEPSYKISTQPVPARDVIHLRPPFGRCPLTLAREAIAVAHLLEAHAAGLFGNGARPSGALKFPKGFGEEAVKKTRAAWQATHEAGTRGRTAILYDDADFVPFTFASTDAQFLENRKFQIAEIARAFRVPPAMLFELDRATWGNFEQQGREFLTYCLEPWLKALEGALGRALLTDEERATHVIRFDRDDTTRADLTARATAINSLVASRVLNPNEGRSWLGMGPYPGGDQFTNPNIDTAAGTAGGGQDAAG